MATLRGMASSTPIDLPNLDGRTIVVTGASAGVGRATASLLADKGARVILAVRNMEKGRAAASTMKGITEVRRLDLADLSSVRAFASSFPGAVDILINNAGISLPPFTRTADGFESQFGTNHLGHFALTNLLLPRIRDRIVTVGSLGHRIGRIDFADLNWHRRPYRPYVAYTQSKLANHLFAFELQRLLTTAGSPVRSILTHPGIAATDLMKAGTGGLRRRLERSSLGLVAHSAEDGALPTLYGVTADLPGGSYIGPARLMGMRGAPAPAKPSPRTRDRESARRLWEESERLTGTTFLPGMYMPTQDVQR